MNDDSPGAISTSNAEHYTWGDNCDGWHLLKSDALSIIQERMPPGTAEVAHYHQTARQFFFVLSGEATLIFTDQTIILNTYEGIEVPPLVVHQLRNESTSDVIFTVTSMPKSHGDRVLVD